MFQKIIALSILVVAGVIGFVSYLSFMFFLYNGSFDWIKLNLGESETLMLNGGLCLVFFLQHSGMIRRSFRKSLSSFIPTCYQGAIYTLSSGITLLLFIAFWQSSGTILLAANGLLQYILRLLFFLAILGMLWGLYALSAIDIFGLNPILKHIAAMPIQEGSFTVRGPYRWVRHPLYLFMIVLFWCYPILTTDRLLFNILWTTWVVVGTVLEERDLLSDFGDAYRDYQAKVPMLFPKGFRPFYPIR
jgi:protein-S-isoprenylcysteine O-methyltransferase Ste14